MSATDLASAAAPPRDDASGRSIVLFDFDGVLGRGDSGGRFLRERILRSRWRTALALLATPVALPLFAMRRTLSHGARIYAWIARVGDSHETFDAHVRDYALRNAADPRRAIADGMAELARMRESGARVVIVTGSLEPIVRAQLEQHGIDGVEIVASRRQPVRRHCYGEAKLPALAEAGIVPPWDVAYSDSLADLPMLRHARRPVLVNMDEGMASRAAAALRRVPERVRWE